MKKSLIALATLVAFAGAASAQSSVTIGGKLDLGVGKAINSKDKGVRDAAGSRLNFMITEDLGGGMRAIGGFEHRFNPDDGTDASANPSTTPATPRSNMWNGFSWVGLRGGFGTVKLGRDYTASFTHIQNQIDPFGGDTVAALRTASLIPGAAGATPGQVRFGNGVKYENSFGGFNVAFNISESGLSNWGTSVPTNVNRAWSIAANYSMGPLWIGAGHENAAGSNDKLSNFGARYTIGAMTLRAGLANGTTNANVKVKGYLVGANVRMGAGDIRFGYANAKSGTTTTVKKLGLGYHYDLSKRTKLYADFARDSAASNTINKTGYDFGIQHNF